MAKTPSAKRYARAAFELARDASLIEQWGADLSRAHGALQSRGLYDALKFPKLTVAQKVAMVRGAVSGVHPLALNLLSLLASRDRIGLLPGLIEEFQALADAHYGRVRALVTTAVPLQGDQEQRIKAQLEGMIGSQVVITARVDAEIMGGVMARVGDRIIDGSLRGRLIALKRHLAEARG
ncbi:MAG: F0F1 ATP synthase subunit delta [Chloroflexi bacterium]|nr:F0F1 ATP synthase subunit delta [Chloroflexota bacterium]